MKNLQLKNSNNVSHDSLVSVELTIRELELIHAYSGLVSDYKIAQEVNNSLPVTRNRFKPFVTSEVEKSILGAEGFAVINDFLKEVEDLLPPAIIKTVEFVYDKRDGTAPKWRTLEVISESNTEFTGIEDGSFKKFLKNRIIGGRVITK